MKLKNITSLFLTFAIMLCSVFANAQSQYKRQTPSKNPIHVLLAKQVKEKPVQSPVRSKKATVKKLATYTYVGMNEVTGKITDTSERYVITWGNNDIPTQITVEGMDDDIVEDETVPFRLVYNDFVKVNSASGSEFDWFYEDADFDSKSGIMETFINNKWQNYARFEKVINAQGFVQENIVSLWQNNQWEKTYRDVYTYDAAGRQTVSMEQNWDGTKWVDDFKFTEFYDAQGRYIGSEEMQWNDLINEWEMTYGNKYIYTMNASNEIESYELQYYNSEDDVWVRNQRQSFEWAAGKITQATTQAFNPGSGQWEDYTQYKNIDWKEFDATNNFSYPVMIGGDKYNSLESYNYDNFSNSWTINEKYINTFTGSNVTESVTLMSNGTGWDTMRKTTYAYYPNGDDKETKSWNNNNGNMEVSYAYGSRNTYDSDGDLLTSVSLEWDWTNKVMVEENIEIFTYTEATVGIAKKGNGLPTVNIYPNPVTAGNVNISLPNKAASAKITVYDNVGKTVMQVVSANAGNVSLDVNALPKGLYIINVNQNGSISKAQFIIQ